MEDVFLLLVEEICNLMDGVVAILVIMEDVFLPLRAFSINSPLYVAILVIMEDVFLQTKGGANTKSVQMSQSLL